MVVDGHLGTVGRADAAGVAGLGVDHGQLAVALDLGRARRAGRPLGKRDRAERTHGGAHVAAHAGLGAHRRGRRHAASGRAQEVVDLGGDRRGLGVALDERLGPGGRAADEDALAGGLGGAVLAVEDLDEAVLVGVDVEHAGQAGDVARRHHAVRQHDEVGAQRHLLGDRHVLDLDDRTPVLVELHVGRRAAQELDAGAPRRHVPVLVADAGGAQLEVADRDPHLGEEHASGGWSA